MLAKHAHRKDTTILYGGLSLMLLGILVLLVMTLNMKLSMLSILILITLIIGAIGFINPVVMGKGLALFPNTLKRTGYASSFIGASGLFGATIGAQFSHLITQGSIYRFALASLIIMLVAWLLFFLFMKLASTTINPS